MTFWLSCRPLWCPIFFNSELGGSKTLWLYWSLLLRVSTKYPPIKYGKNGDDGKFTTHFSHSHFIGHGAVHMRRGALNWWQLNSPLSFLITLNWQQYNLTNYSFTGLWPHNSKYVILSNYEMHRAPLVCYTNIFPHDFFCTNVHWLSQATEINQQLSKPQYKAITLTCACRS